MKENQTLIFEDCPYYNYKLFQVLFWLLLTFTLGGFALGIYLLVEGIKTVHIGMIVVGVILIIDLGCFSVLGMISLRRKRIQIYENQIYVISPFKRKRIYQLDCSQITIYVHCSRLFRNGIKLIFIDKNNIKLFSYLLIEVNQAKNQFNKQRHRWAEALKRLGCFIRDPKNLLLS